MPTQEDYLTALAIAREACAEKDPRVQAGHSGAVWTPSGKGAGGAGVVEVPFLTTPYVIRCPGGEVSYKETAGKDPALWEQILLLHYFTTADGTPLSGQWISLKEIPDSRLYLPNFEKRAVAPLLGRFGDRPESVHEPVRRLGGAADVPGGDVGVTVPVFPRVPVTILFWKGDEEFPPRVHILFDRTIAGYLPTEDIILTSQMLAFRLIALAGKG